MNNGQRMMDDDGRERIATGTLSDSGDLKLQFMFMKIVFYVIS